MSRKMIDRIDVAAMIGVEVKTLNNWLADPKHPFPKGVPLGGGARPPRRWFLDEVEAWLEGNNGRKEATAQPHAA